MWETCKIFVVVVAKSRGENEMVEELWNFAVDYAGMMARLDLFLYLRERQTWKNRRGAGQWQERRCGAPLIFKLAGNCWCGSSG
jgi:hypothetical protein